MHTPARILQAHADDIDRSSRDLTTKELERRDLVLRIAEDLFARFGRHTITFTNLALAMRMAPGTLRRLFLDLDILFAEILRRHLFAIASAMGDVPHDAPDQAALRRAAYLKATRLPFGGLTKPHLLLVRDLAVLPEDLRESLESIRLSLGYNLAPGNPHGALALLDMPCFDAAQIEAMLAALPHQPSEMQPAASPAPAEPPLAELLPFKPPAAARPAPKTAAAEPEAAPDNFTWPERHPDDVYIFPDARAAAALNARGRSPPPPA